MANDILTPSAAAPAAHLSPDDYLYASCADPKRTDFRVAPVLPLAPVAVKRTPAREGRAARNRRYDLLSANDAAFKHGMGVA